MRSTDSLVESLQKRPPQATCGIFRHDRSGDRNLNNKKERYIVSITTIDKLHVTIRYLVGSKIQTRFFLKPILLELVITICDFQF